MSDSSVFDARVAVSEKAVRQVPRPPWPGPVLIGDCLSSYGGRPVLLRLWEDWAARDRE